MERIENLEVKQYLIAFSISKLQTCNLFTQTFGKNFAKRRLALNLDKVYTNKIHKKKLGYYTPNDSSITLCTKEENTNILKIIDIKNNPSIQATLLHEAIHAILAKTKWECKMLGIKIGYGMFESYHNGTELGIGLNEGLTNWICNKAELYPTSYPTLTTFIYELELAIGEKNTMKLGKGDIKKNIAKQLKMSISECQAFLSLADEIYSLEDSLINKSNIIDPLLNIAHNNKSLEDFRNSLMQEECSPLEDFLLHKILEDKNYKQFLKNYKKEDILSSRIAYVVQRLKKQIKDEKRRRIECRSEFESRLFTKYFQNEFEELKQCKTVLPDKLKKFDYFYTLINPTEIIENSQIDYFLQDYEKIKQTQQETFRNNISDMSHFSNCIPKNIPDRGIQENERY